MALCSGFAAPSPPAAMGSRGRGPGQGREPGLSRSCEQRPCCYCACAATHPSSSPPPPPARLAGGGAGLVRAAPGTSAGPSGRPAPASLGFAAGRGPGRSELWGFPGPAPSTTGETEARGRGNTCPQMTNPEQPRPRSRVGRALSTAYCRLCHGKFSSRSLRNAFGKVPVTGANSEKQRRVDQVFFTDFQRLVGVAVQQDPALPQYVCKKCHAQFYKCRSILKSFIQRVNASPTGQRKPKGKSSDGQPPSAPEAPCLVDPITASPHCLHGLVTWTHSHAGSCPAVPSLRRVLSSEYCGIIRAAWGCGQGHDYMMETESDCSAALADGALAVTWEWNKSPAQRVTDNGASTGSAGATPAPRPQLGPARTAACEQPGNPGTPSEPLSPENPLPPSRNSSQSPPDCPVFAQESQPPPSASPLSSAAGQRSGKQALAAPADERVKAEFSDLSEGDFLSEEENEKRTGQSSDDSFEPYPDKKASSHRKGESKEAKKADEPKIRKKPGPKPGWKKKIKCEREELPTIYKCPYQGCTAVYRGADGMKKHIKEHHEEVRERPCPHPGCNKVFMIDRYLQRHVKLIHTEVRNYICDECGQTFKQRKHLSVHQMRHSGAKPLQQRASLKYHMTKHKAEAELEFACDQCGKRFEKAHNLNVHMSMVHPLTQTQDKAKPQEPEQILPLDPAGTAESQAVKPELTAQQEPT
ncbi:zinc finger protein 276 isoform X2 [Pelodiscus sinensis]|uniref:zinc finger protein 276 isoform X2 n=1 Tax=Pelodiscus sinensis TaxID=13735 RepID=UPI003F6CBA68